jgi:hypothetical protein
VWKTLDDDTETIKVLEFEFPHLTQMQLHKLTYIESRQFYCNFYERFALKDENFRKLKQMLKDGMNLQVIAVVLRASETGRFVDTTPSHWMANL